MAKVTWAAILMLFVLIVWLFVAMLIRTRQVLAETAEFDVLVHHSTDKMPLPTFIREMHNFHPDILTGTNLLTNLKQSETFGHGAVPQETANYLAYNNDRTQISSEFCEAWLGRVTETTPLDVPNYMGISRAKFRPLSNVSYYKLGRESQLLIAKVMRLSDGKTFYHVHLTQNLTKYLSTTAYNAIYLNIMFIKRNFPGSYVISGNFNVHGHESIFRYLLPDHWVCDFIKMPTVSTEKLGFASPDGIVIAKDLYDRVEYTTDMCGESESHAHFVLRAKLYPTHPHRGVYAEKNWRLKSMIDVLKSEITNESSLYGNVGVFDPIKHSEEPNYNAKPITNFTTDTTLSAPTT